jgi:hypothetical protein
MDIVDVATPAGNERRVFDAFRRGADEAVG